ncbi:MAG: HK97 family phage prohead protease [Anaerolineaceae bacterium]|nr:HK97 family phage prohead protease [Anaerolineaceae bacterium]
MPEKIERRTFTFEMRESEGDEKPKIIGYAAVFNSLSEEMWGFKERVLPGAFAETIKRADIRALWNHDANYVLGRNTSGTLTLAEDQRGLKIEIDPPDVQWARDLMYSMKRGDVDQMSFGFRVVSDHWHKENDEVLRDLVEVELFDVSPVTYPAYTQTVVHARDMQSIYQAEIEALSQKDGESSEADGADTQKRSSEMQRRRLDLLEQEIRI